jgi:hypothetical protein
LDLLVLLGVYHPWLVRGLVSKWDTPIALPYIVRVEVIVDESNQPKGKAKGVKVSVLSKCCSKAQSFAMMTIMGDDE